MLEIPYTPSWSMLDAIMIHLFTTIRNQSWWNSMCTTLCNRSSKAYRLITIMWSMHDHEQWMCHHIPASQTVIWWCQRLVHDAINGCSMIGRPQVICIPWTIRLAHLGWWMGSLDCDCTIRVIYRYNHGIAQSMCYCSITESVQKKCSCYGQRRDPHTKRRNPWCLSYLLHATAMSYGDAIHGIVAIQSILSPSCSIQSWLEKFADCTINCAILQSVLSYNPHTMGDGIRKSLIVAPYMDLQIMGSIKMGMIHEWPTLRHL